MTDEQIDISKQYYLFPARVLPFRIGVNFDNNEANVGAKAESTNELSGFPGGIIGFKLTYWQVAC